MVMLPTSKLIGEQYKFVGFRYLVSRVRVVL